MLLVEYMRMRGNKQKQNKEKKPTQKRVGKMNKGRREILTVLEGKKRRHGHDREMRFNSITDSFMKECIYVFSCLSTFPIVIR